ncbi:MAG: hypothetical protein AAF447_11585, partial [Myxococcota bacterium]
SSEAVPPPRQESSISSRATIPDGFAVAVGGIEIAAESESEAGIPILSDIPVLGNLFKDQNRSFARSKFYVFIRPTIMRGDRFAYLKSISGPVLDEFEINNVWPEVEPRGRKLLANVTAAGEQLAALEAAAEAEAEAAAANPGDGESSN